MLIHIKRKFLNIPLGKKESIYSIPNINNGINQLFIDNLNEPNKYQFRKYFKEKLWRNNIWIRLLIDEETEFKKTLLNFVFAWIISRRMLKIDPEEYIDDLTEYIDVKLNKKIKKLIDEDVNQKFDNGSLINKILKEIKKNNVDLISCVIDCIKENIFDKYLEKIFEFLEKCNFHTSLIESDKDINNKKTFR